MILDPDELSGICGQQWCCFEPLFFCLEPVAALFQYFRARGQLLEFFGVNQGVTPIADESFGWQLCGTAFADGRHRSDFEGTRDRNLLPGGKSPCNAKTDEQNDQTDEPLQWLRQIQNW